MNLRRFVTLETAALSGAGRRARLSSMVTLLVIVAVFAPRSHPAEIR